MIRESPEEFLAIIRSHTPDPKMPLAVVREDFSAFYKDMQEETTGSISHQVEKVMFRDGVWGYWLSVAESDPDYVVLFFHAGGFTTGSTEDYLGLCLRLARAARATVFSVDYRLAPEHVFPAPVEDAVAAYRYLQSRGYPPHRILPVGISAGGTLVIGLLLTLRDQRLTPPPAAVCLSPAVDMLFEGESVSKNQERDWITAGRLHAIRTVYLAGHDPQDPIASPLHASLAGLPRLYIQVGTHELLLSDVGKFVDKARWAGVPVQAELWEGMFHCWQVFAEQIPEAQQAIEHTGQFIRGIQAR